MNQERRVLVVDSSKVVRATLAKHLKDTFSIREEANGEAAWQTLVLDSSIVAVVSGVQLPKLDAYGLLDRLRENKLRRLSRMPFLLLMSGAENAADKEKAKARGVSDFITKTMGKAEILGKLKELVAAAETGEELEDEILTDSDVGGTQMLAQAIAWPPLAHSGTAESKAPGKGIESRLPDPTPLKLLCATEIESRISLALAVTDVRRSAVSVMALGVDQPEALVRHYGADTLNHICAKIARLLQSKIGGSDCMGQLRAGRLVILARGSRLEQCMGFAERVCRSVAESQLTVGGRQLSITLSAGVASVPQDGGLSGDDLLLLANRRLNEAMEKGGNRIVAQGKGARQRLSEADQLVSQALSSLKSGVEGGCLATAGLQIMPLLRALDREFGFQLPLEDMERQLEQRALKEVA